MFPFRQTEWHLFLKLWEKTGSFYTRNSDSESKTTHMITRLLHSCRPQRGQSRGNQSPWGVIEERFSERFHG